MSDEFDFSDLEVVEIPVTAPDKSKYLLKVASGAAAAQFRNERTKCFSYTSSGQVSKVEGLADIEPLLVSLCLFTAEDNKPVSKFLVKSWPSPMVKKLYGKAIEISSLDESSPDRKQLGEALALEGSPISLADLQKYIVGLDPVKYKALQLWSKPTTEEDAKNSQSAMTGGSV